MAAWSGISRFSDDGVAVVGSRATSCRQNVGSTCPKVAGRQATHVDAGGPLTCCDTSSNDVRTRPGMCAHVPCSRGS